MSFALQSKLLRMLEDKKIRRVGGQKEVDVDVRILAATNRNLEKLVSEKKFREDLLFRLNTIQIAIPPLRERSEDILLLANKFLEELSDKNERKMDRFSPDAEKALLEHYWNGNVRELNNMIERAFYLCTDSYIHRYDLPIPAENHAVTMNNQILDLSYK